MIQLQADRLRAWLAGRHQTKAFQHVRLRDHWRWQVHRPWPELVPKWLPWAMLGGFWLLVCWALT